LSKGNCRKCDATTAFKRRYPPPPTIGTEPGSSTRENSPTRYEEYRTTLFGRKLQKTEKVKAARGWKKLHASTRPQAANRKTSSSRRHKGIKKSCACSPFCPFRSRNWRVFTNASLGGLRLQAPARKPFLDEDGYVEFPDIGRLVRLTAAEKEELDEAIRLSK